jgi:predicted nucleic acid-binding protein
MICAGNCPLAEPAAVNASPLIVLARIDQIDLLRMESERVVVPATVAMEIAHRGRDDPAARLLATHDWLDVVDTGPMHELVRACDLDAGESAVLSWALSHQGATAILDDLKGRRCAMRLGIRVRGTLGLILVARRRGMIPAARPVIVAVRRAGLYLSDAVIEAALAEIGE